MEPIYTPDPPGLSTRASINGLDNSRSQLLSEAELRQTARSLHVLFDVLDHTPGSDELGNIKLLQLDALRVAYAIGIPSSHRTAACNLLCAILTEGLVARETTISSLIVSKEIWQAMFNVYLDRFEESHVKSMRQVLVTLVSSLARWPYPGTARLLRDNIVRTFLYLIYDNHYMSRLKPALQGLEYIINHKVVLIRDVVHSLRGLVPSLDRYSTEGLVDQSGEAGSEAVKPDISTSESGASSEALIEHFLSTLLGWVSHTDVTPATSRLISTFFKFLRLQSSKEVNFYHSVTMMPLWASPLKRSLEKKPESLEVLKRLVLPELFKLSRVDLLQFVEDLPLRLLLSGAVHGDTSTTEVLLLFSSLQAAQDLDLVRVTDRDFLESGPAESTDILVPLAACGQFLTHKSAAIRVATLHFLLSSDSTTKPYRPPVLDIVRDNLAYFHADTETAVRSDVIGIERCMLKRLRGAISHIGRTTETHGPKNLPRGEMNSSGPDFEGPIPEQSSASQQLVDEHKTFLKWYINFLVSELRPTASYQRHITALKALTVLLQSGLDNSVPQTFLSRDAQGGVKWSFNVFVFQPLLHRMLFDLSMDSFDDVRNAAVFLLKIRASALSHGQQEPTMPFPSLAECSITNEQAAEGFPQLQQGSRSLDVVEILSRAQEVLHSTGRADHADGVARLYEVLDQACVGRTSNPLKGLTVENTWWSSRFGIVEHILHDLENGLALAKINLRLAVAGAPIQGHLVALRYIIIQPHFGAKSLQGSQGWKALHERMLACCDDVWNCVRDTLCVDSPEGHTTEDLDDLDIGVKDTLSYSWRALKEASALLHAMLLNKSYSPQASTGLQYEDIYRIGRLSFTQLADLRHRGAFSAVSQTFAACCAHCAQSPDNTIGGLLDIWYQDMLTCIQDKGAKVTRRSAGIPALAVGILAARPQYMMLKNFLDLEEIALRPVDEQGGPQERDLPQVHALNCVKNIYINTKLGAYSEVHLSEGLDLAAMCLESKIWAIRNCGLMLFRALTDRLFGTNEPPDGNELQDQLYTLRLSYDKYPTLIPLLIKLLGGNLLRNASSRSHDSDISSLVPAELVFPALDILRRAGAPATEDDIIVQLVMQHLGSKIWSIREMAARTYCSIMSKTEYVGSLAPLLDSNRRTSNRWHGNLMAVKLLVDQHFRVEKGAWQEHMTPLVTLLRPLSHIFVHNKCPFLTAAYVDIINLLLSKALLARDRRTVVMVMRVLDDISPAESSCQEMEELWNKMQGRAPFVDRRPMEYAESLLVRSVAWSLALHYLAQSRRADLQKILRRLSDTDSDTACAVIRSLAKHTLSQGCMYEDSALFYDILQYSVHPKVRAVATEGYLYLLDKALLIQDNGDSLEEILSRESALLPLVERNPKDNPHELGDIDLDLRMRGYQLFTVCCNNAPISTEVEKNVVDWSRMLSRAGDDGSELSTRYAAVRSINAFRTVLRPIGGLPNTSSALLGMYLALYDTLNDDDEDVRDLGADVVSWIISTPSTEYSPHSLVPLDASLRLSMFLAESYSESRQLFTEAMHRLTGQPKELTHLDGFMRGSTSTVAAAFPSVKDLLITARTQDTSLFMEEKHNLFIDEVREAEIWSRVLRLLSNAACNKTIGAEFSNWIVCGVDTLAETAKSETDGPLGWTSKPEVFTLGMRVIWGAGVNLYWNTVGIGIVSDVRVLKGLEQLRDVGRKSSVHEMWIEHIGWILEEKVSANGN